MRKVITIDGPSGVGKGTVSKQLAQALGFVCLDSGALYRLSALEVARHGLEQAEAREQARVLTRMTVPLDGQSFDQKLRSEATARMASELAGKAEIRAALVPLQRHFGGNRGLVADGRDMGTVVFPDADLKIFLDAKCEVRAERRYKQLKAQKETVNLAALEQEIAARDARDRNRSVAPLKPASDAVLIDTTELSVEQVVWEITDLFSTRCKNFQV